MQIGLRWQAAELAAIDDWRHRQDDQPSRAEAIRRLVEKAIGPGVAGTSKVSARRASKLALREIESLIDKSEPAETQERRKRQLIHGPKEFRGVRKDQPKGKA
jgi:hypothetical protein